MAKIALIGCTSKKETFPCPAIELYAKSPLFRKELLYAKNVLKVDSIYILSAKHHLVRAEKVLSPYNETLNNASVCARKRWAEMVYNQIKKTIKQEDVLYLLCGQRYCEFLIPLLRKDKISYYTPLYEDGKKKQIGELLSWLNKEIQKENGKSK